MHASAFRASSSRIRTPGAPAPGRFLFVYIHPFMDGNGRLARFLMNQMLGGPHSYNFCRKNV